MAKSRFWEEMTSIEYKGWVHPFVAGACQGLIALALVAMVVILVEVFL